MSNLWDVKAVAEYLAISVSSVYRYSERNELPHIKKFGLRFKKEDIDSWLDKDKRKNILIDIILKNALTNLPPLVIDKAKGGKEMARATKSRRNYGYGAVYIRKTRKGHPRYYIDYRDRTGMRTQKLIKNALNWQEAHEALKNAVLKEHYKECGIKESKQPIKFKEFADMYLETYAKVNKKSWRDDKYRLKKLKEFFKDAELSEITPLMLENFRASRLNEGNTKSTTNRHMALLKKMFNLAIDWGYLKENPVNKVKLFSEKDNFRERVLTEEEEKRLLDKSSGYVKSIVIIALNTGMRLGEILSLKWSQVDFSSKKIRVEKTKSGKIRFININTPLLNEFLKLRSSRNQKSYLFFNTETGKPLTTVKKAFKSACGRAKIEGLRFHDLRHTFASRLNAKGVDIETIRSFLGHCDITVTQRYTHSNQELRRRAVELLAEKTNCRHKNKEDLLHIRYTEKSDSLNERLGKTVIPSFSEN